jgi:cytoskeletal protein CcmA (bactofilin family)
MKFPGADAQVAERLAGIPTVIDAGASFEGLLTFRGAARVDGQLTGRVVADGCLVIGPRGRVAATVEVDELVVGGEFEGEVTARTRVELLPGGRAAGRLRAPSFALADGCRFDGQWETVRPSAEAAVEPLEDAAAGARPPLAEGASAP